jgi:hypothetical protein
MASKLVRGQPYFKSQKTTTIAQTSFSSFKSPKTTMSIIVVLSIRKKIVHVLHVASLETCIPHNTIRFCCFAFAPPNMFLKVVDFGKSLSLPLVCVHTQHLTICAFPLKPKRTFAHGSSIAQSS